MKFTKMHGAGNDYVYVDGRGLERDWSAFSIIVSDRHRGIGSDGLIVALPSDQADLRMEMFNADGSVGKMCGNGIRCLVAFALEKGILAHDSNHVVVDTLSGYKTVSPVWINGAIKSAAVNMGAPIFNPDDVPVVAPQLDQVMNYPIEVNGQTFSINCVSMGNPHAVAFIEDPVDEMPLHEIGPQIEHHPMFPERVNFEIANLVGEDHIRARVWERGSGLTEACGSGACAIGVVAHLNGRTGGKVNVSLPGGDLRVSWMGQGSEVILEGPVEFVFEGEWPD